MEIGYLLVALVGIALVWFARGFFTAAGKDAYDTVKQEIDPPEEPPVKVDTRFEPDRYTPGSCAWVPELKVPDRNERGIGTTRMQTRERRCTAKQSYMET